MSRRSRLFSLSVLVLSASAPAFARDETPNKAKGVLVRPAPSASASAGAARPLNPSEEDAPLPPGHPQMPPSDGDDDDGEAEETPHAGVPGMFQPTPDSSKEDPSLPPGTITVEVVDADNKPLGQTPLVLVSLRQSVAKGQQKDNRPVTTDEQGKLRLDHLPIGSDVSYWVKRQVDGATFGSVPVQLGPRVGAHVILHVYPVMHDLETAMVVCQAAMYVEVKDDRVQVEEALTFFNFGKTAWVPESLVLKLPKDFTALTSQAMMSDQGIDTAEKVGAKIRGTFAPGRHDLEFRWQLPYDGERELAIDVAMPPHVAVMRVLSAAGRDTTLEVTGFPAAQKRLDRQGQRILVTEKQVQRSSPIDDVHVMIRGLVVPGPGRVVVTAFAAFVVLLGIFLGVKPRELSKKAGKTERQRLLVEVEELERARLRGEVGPKTYERARRRLVDAIALTFDPIHQGTPREAV